MIINKGEKRAEAIVDSIHYALDYIHNGNYAGRSSAVTVLLAAIYNGYVDDDYQTIAEEAIDDIMYDSVGITKDDLKNIYDPNGDFGNNPEGTTLSMLRYIVQDSDMDPVAADIITSALQRDADARRNRIVI